MNFKHWIAAVVAFAAITVLPLASAAQKEGPGKEGSWYVGFSFGDSDIDNSALDDDSGTKFFGGYHFTDRYAIEGGWVDLGSFDIKGFPGDVDVDGIQVAGVAYFPVGKQSSIFGKAGLFLWDASGPLGLDDDGTDLMFGFGFQWTTKKWGWRAEWERFDDVDIDLLSVGVFYRR